MLGLVPIGGLEPDFSRSIFSIGAFVAITLDGMQLVKLSGKLEKLGAGTKMSIKATLLTDLNLLFYSGK